MSLSFEQFVDRLRASSLMSREDIETFVDSLSPQDQPQDGEQLARLLVKQHKLTAFQAQQIYGGNQKSLVLGNYIVLDKLGQGGMGMVLKAEHRRMHRLVALKILSPKATNSPAAAKRFHREVEAAAKLEHPNIVTAYDADESDGTHFLVMQYVEGKDLSALVKKKGPLAVDKAVNCILQAACGLQYAHEQGVVHRDIKPANLLVDDKGTVQILDMGLARLENTGGNPDQAELTSTGQIMGTVDYMAPEQALSTKDADARSDIYSLGITLWYLLTGRAAYDGDNLTAKLLAHQQAPIPSLSAANSAVPAQLDDLFRKMVAKDRNERHQSMAEVIADLERCLAPTASAPTITSATSEDSKFHAFLENLDADKSQATIASSDQKQITAEQQPKTEHAATISYDSSTEETNHQIDVEQSQSAATLPKSGRTSKLTIDWHDRRLQISAASVALLLFVIGLFWGLNDSSNDNSPQGSGKSHPPGSPPPLAIAPFSADQARVYQKSWAKYLGVDLEKRVELPGGKTMSFVLIPPGEFTMGSPNDGSQSNDDSRRVKISKPFYLAKYELTQAEWLAVMGNNPSQFKGDLSLPVESVRWDDSKDLLSQLNASIAKGGMTFLLPTEAQWEYACRAGTTEHWHFGDNESLLSEYGFFKNNSVGGTHAVGGGKPNPWGLYDMYGNVWEWCADWYSEFESEPNLLQDPVGPVSGERRVNRGGSWSAHAYSCRSAYRAHNPPTEAYGGIGFRLALTIEFPDAGNDISPGSPESKPRKPPPLAVAPFDEERAKQHREAWAKYLGVSVEKDVELPGGGQMSFVLIPPGEFMMGSGNEEQEAFANYLNTVDRKISPFFVEREGPRHSVRIDRPFWLGKYEITREQFRQFERATQYQERHPTGGDEHGYGFVDGEFRQRPKFGWDADLGFPQTDEHPVVNVSWTDATAFCRWLTENTDDSTFLLPTESQWEYACRAGTETYWYSGDNPDNLKDYAWIAANSEMKSHPVGELLPNSFGLHDTLGNVWEHCSDWFSNDYYRSSPVLNPSGPESGKGHPHRGGAWHTEPMDCRSAVRIHETPGSRHYRVGFRVAMTINSAKLPPLEVLRVQEPSTNTALTFNGKDSYVEIPSLRHDGSRPITIEAIIYHDPQDWDERKDFDTIPGQGHLLDDVLLGLADRLGIAELVISGTARNWEAKEALSSGWSRTRLVPPVATGWTHIAQVYQKQQHQIFVNGNLVETTQHETGTVAGSFSANNYTSSIGASLVATGERSDKRHFKGRIAGVRISDGVRYSKNFKPLGPKDRFTKVENTIALYQFDEAGGTILNDSSGNNHHGKIVNAKWVTIDGQALAEKTNYALEFNGNTSVVNTPIQFDGKTPLTVEAYVTRSAEAKSGDLTIVADAEQGGFGLEHYVRNGQLAFGVHDSRRYVYARAAALPPETKTHLAAVIDGDKTRLYANGRLVATGQLDGGVKPSPFKIAIGANPHDSGPAKVFVGTIDEVRISSSARYADNFAPRPRLETDGDTIALYHFDEGSGEVAIDSSGNDHHGRVVDAKWVASGNKSLLPLANHALAFDGTAHVNIPTLKIASPPQLTIEAIVKAESPHRGMIVSNAGRAGFGFKISNDRWKFDGYGMQSKFAVFADQKAAYNKWTHVSAVIDGNQVWLFVDGQMQQKTATIDQLKPSAAWVAIGANPEANGIAEPFRGAIRMVRISKTARYQSSFQVPASFDKDINTLALYNFHQGQGSKLLDSSGNNHHGNIVNAMWVNLANTPPIDPERTVADQVLQAGGYLSLQIDDDGQSSPKTVNQIDHLPKESFVLRAIYLSNVKGIGDDQLRHLANLRGLVEIHLHNTAVTDKGLQHLQSIESLNNINIYGTQVTDEGLKSLDGLPFLFSLSLTNTPAEQSGITGLKTLRALRRLLVSNSISSQRILELSQATQLRELDISGEAPHVTPALVDEFQKQNPHCRVRISNGNPVGRDPVRELAQWVQQVGGNLTLADYAPDAGYKQFGKSDPLPTQHFRIRTIDLSECSELVDDDLKRLTAAVFLHDLRLSRTNISDAGIAHLKSSPTLGSIWLSDTRVTDKSLQQLAAMPRVNIYYLQGSQVTSSGLKYLVDGPPLQWLNIGGRQVNSEALNHVSRQVRLRSLVMTNGEIGDKEIQQLATLKRLEKLDLTGTLVTKAGAEQLASKLPQCRITFGPPEAKATIEPPPEK